MKFYFWVLFLIKLIYLNENNQEEAYCKKNILSNYNLKGLEISEKIEFVSNICPNIINSCCSKDDIINSIYEWNNKLRIKIEKNYEDYLNLIIELLKQKNYLNEIIKNNNFDNSKKQCYQLKFDYIFIKKNWEVDKIIKFYSLGFQTLAYLRKGIVCSVCNAKNHQYMITKKEKPGNWILSEDYCINFIKLLEDYFRYKFNIVTPFLFIINTLNNCLIDEEIPFKFNFKNIQYEDFEKCLNNKFEYDPLNSTCKKFCKNFDLNKFNDLIDGDLKYLDKFVNFIIKNKEFNTIDYENLNINTNNKIYDNPNPMYDLSNFKILIKKDGINLFKEANNNGFELTLNSKNINIYEEIYNKIKKKKIDEKYEKDYLNKNKALKLIKNQEQKFINSSLKNVNLNKFKIKSKLSKLNENEIPNQDFLDNLKNYINEKENSYLINLNKIV